jgi:hypothetical protein
MQAHTRRLVVIARPLSRLLAVPALVMAAFAASADQSCNPGGVHEIPPFVRERVELPSGAPDDVADKDDRGDRAQGDDVPALRRSDGEPRNSLVPLHRY